VVFIVNTIPQVVGSRNKCIGDSKAKSETDAIGFEKYKTQEGVFCGTLQP
jgi:hypothetical protein